MEKDIDREKFKEKKRAELEVLYDAVNEETLMIAEDPEKFSAYLRIQARFNRYTVTNAILLLHQFPDAQKLKTFEGWKREEHLSAEEKKAFRYWNRTVIQRRMEAWERAFA